MGNLFKLIAILAIAGFVASIFNGGGVHSIGDVLGKIENLLNTTDFGPLNGVADDIKAAIAYARQELPKLLEMLNKG